ncbi:MAG: SDR family oxidoreductase [Lautropia sp.]
MHLDLAGRTALVLGGTRGLGLACATALAAEGVRVLLNGRDRAHGSAVASRLENAAFVPGDVGIVAERSALIDAVKSIAEPDIIVTNAGGPPAGPFESTDAAMWRKAFETSIAGPLEVVRAFLPSMRLRRFGRIVNVTSFVVKELYPNMSLSNSVRVGLTGAMGALAREVAADGITINGLLPGLIDTGALERVIRDRMKRSDQSEAEVRVQMEAGIPMGRLGVASDFGPLCAFIASPLAAYITGQNICVDGGLTKNVI